MDRFFNGSERLNMNMNAVDFAAETATSTSTHCYSRTFLFCTTKPFELDHKAEVQKRGPFPFYLASLLHLYLPISG